MSWDPWMNRQETVSRASASISLCLPTMDALWSGLSHSCVLAFPAVTCCFFKLQTSINPSSLNCICQVFVTWRRQATFASMTAFPPCSIQTQPACTQAQHDDIPQMPHTRMHRRNIAAVWLARTRVGEGDKKTRTLSWWSKKNAKDPWHVDLLNRRPEEKLAITTAGIAHQ